MDSEIDTTAAGLVDPEGNPIGEDGQVHRPSEEDATQIEPKTYDDVMELAPEQDYMEEEDIPTSECDYCNEQMPNANMQENPMNGVRMCLWCFANRKGDELRFTHGEENEARFYGGVVQMLEDAGYPDDFADSIHSRRDLD